MTHCECSAPTHNLLLKTIYSLGLFGSSPHYKDLLLSVHPSQTPYLPLHNHGNTQHLSLTIPAEEDTMVNFNNTSSSSSSNVAKLWQSIVCVNVCVSSPYSLWSIWPSDIAGRRSLAKGIQVMLGIFLSPFLINRLGCNALMLESAHTHRHTQICTLILHPAVYTCLRSLVSQISSPFSSINDLFWSTTHLLT